MTYYSHLIFLLLILTCMQLRAQEETQARFDLEKDLLLLHYDVKTDIDDLHSVAAMRTLIAIPDYADIHYHAVAGTYGTQSGLYVPPNDLFELAFGENWSDAHTDFDQALDEVKAKVLATLADNGTIWIAEGGQSDFSAALVRAIQTEQPDLITTDRIHLVQHADWNEEVTTVDDLAYVKKHTNYHRITSGNAGDNGTPDFRSDEIIDVEAYIHDQALRSVWELAIDLADTYNGKEDRYLNEDVQAGGLDFSDFAEVCWMLGLEGIKDAKEFFQLYAEHK